ncbi:MAG TPA: hypothetical protein VIF15_05730 [Polyangiaceae bacterium]|jgi:hypothetical protein
MASVILGEWTHRRGDPGGARAVPAEIDRPRPAVAWSWRPEHGGCVDQVRVAGENVVVATMMPRDPGAPGWEHAVVYALDARTGIEVARRVLPDPVPVAAMVVEAGLLHVIAARRGEPIFWYALSPVDLVPRHRRIVAFGASAPPDDVLDAWAAPDGGLWLELDTAGGADARRTLAYAFAGARGDAPASYGRADDVSGEHAAVARDACAGGHELFTPVDGVWRDDAPPAPPALARLDPGGGAPAAGSPWARASVVGHNAQIHALGGDGVICAVAAAEDPERPDRVRIEAFAVDRTSGVVRWRAQTDRIAVKPRLGDAARVARRSNGELLFQSLGSDGSPCTPLVCARPDGQLDAIVLGARGRYVLDAALGDLVLAHRENKEGAVEVGGFAIDHEGRLLGRRAVARWAIDVGDLGGSTTVYAGAGAVVVRGTRALCAVRL